MDSAKLTIERFRDQNGRLPNVGELGIYDSLFVEKTNENMDRYFGKSSIKNIIQKIPKQFDNVSDLYKENLRAWR